MIREATPADIPDLVDMAERFLAESPYGAVMQADRASMARLGRMLIAKPHGLMLAAEGDAGAPVGMIGVLATLHPYSGAPVMSEMFWYVAPEARGAGVRLLRRAEDWGRANGLAAAIMVAPDERVGGFLTRIGYRPVETHFIKEL